MPVVRTAVLLFAYPAGQNLDLHGDVLWYRNYFFGPVYGQAGYWIKQTDSHLAALIGTASVTPVVLSQEESVELVHQVVEQEPHFSEREAHLAERELHLAERQPGERVDATREPGGFLAFLRRVLGRILGR